MLQALPRRGFSLAAVAVAALLASCATPEPEPAPAPPPPPAVVHAPPPPVSLNEGVAQAASIYVAFMREAGTVQTLLGRSISDHVAPNTSPLRAAVRIRNSRPLAATEVLARRSPRKSGRSAKGIAA